MTTKEEIANLSDKALEHIGTLLNEQYKLGFQYAYEVIFEVVQQTKPEINKKVTEVTQPYSGTYLRALIINRKD